MSQKRRLRAAATTAQTILKVARRASVRIEAVSSITVVTTDLIVTTKTRVSRSR
jgi:hypothetical protein